MSWVTRYLTERDEARRWMELNYVAGEEGGDPYEVETPPDPERLVQACPVCGDTADWCPEPEGWLGDWPRTHYPAVEDDYGPTEREWC